jgi:hypothetical protein
MSANSSAPLAHHTGMTDPITPRRPSSDATASPADDGRRPDTRACARFAYDPESGTWEAVTA